MEEVKFDPKFTEAIRNDEKTATIRAWDELRLLPGDPFVAKEDTEEEDIIANLMTSDVYELAPYQIVQEGVEGHRDYDSVGELMDELEEYYPDQVLTEDMVLQVITW